MTAQLMDEPATYRIRVQGRPRPGCSDRLGGLTVTIWEGVGGAPFAELTGQLADEAALMGVLEHLCNLRMPLLGVERVGIGRTKETQRAP
jgi:hypothetical protein